MAARSHCFWTYIKGLQFQVSLISRETIKKASADPCLNIFWIESGSTPKLEPPTTSRRMDLEGPKAISVWASPLPPRPPTTTLPLAFQSAQEQETSPVRTLEQTVNRANP